MSAWMQKFRGDGGYDAPPGQRRRVSVSAPPKDPNVPKKRLQIHQKCLYERTLVPGHAFISAHANRLQHGFYESTQLHEDNLDNVYFVSVHFVFHPHDPRSHRFKSADIEVCVHGDEDPFADVQDRARPFRSHPRILKHAPELMFGAVSPENLQWNFSLSSSLGVSQAPVAATLNPTGGMKGSYKVFHMMSVQGSIRSKRSPLGSEHDVEDAMAVWTLEENILQRSGLPREFDFVLLIHKPDDVKNVYLTIDVDAEVEAWFGAYPKWYANLSKYMPTQDLTLDFNADIGQRFVPSQPGRGFNFATLPCPLDEYVTMPGTVYPTNDTKEDDDVNGNPEKHGRKSSEDKRAVEASPTSPSAQQPLTSPQRRTRTPRQSHTQGSAANRQSWAPENLNVRVVLEHQYPQQPSDARRCSYSPLSNQDPSRYPSIRRRKSRSGLKEYGAKQALQELAQDTLEEQEDRGNRPNRPNGHA